MFVHVHLACHTRPCAISDMNFPSPAFPERLYLSLSRVPQLWTCFRSQSRVQSLASWAEQSRGPHPCLDSVIYRPVLRALSCRQPPCHKLPSYHPTHLTRERQVRERGQGMLWWCPLTKLDNKLLSGDQTQSLWLSDPWLTVKSSPHGHLNFLIPRDFKISICRERKFSKYFLISKYFPAMISNPLSPHTLAHPLPALSVVWDRPIPPYQWPVLSHHSSVWSYF